MRFRNLVARRSIMQAAGLGALAGLVGGRAQAQTEMTRLGEGPVWSREYTVKKGDTPLHVFRKRLGAPGPDSAKPPVLFLVHGSSNSGRSTFDLTVPGRPDYSLMDKFARYGFDVWTMDHDGYGRSGSSGNNSDIASGVEDLKAATELVIAETGQGKAHFLGTSSGAIRAGAFAVARPDRVDRLVLVAFTYKGTNSPTLTNRAKRIDELRANTRRLRDREMIRSIFTRDRPGTTDMAVADALADEEMKFGNQVPTGTYLDMVANLPLVDPKKVTAPVMMLRGEYDGIATMEDLLDFYVQLPNGDKQFVVLPGVAHSVVPANNRHLFWHAVREFLTMPAPVGT